MIKSIKDFKVLVRLLKFHKTFINGVLADDDDKFRLCEEIFKLRDNIKKLVQHNNYLLIETL